MVALLCVSISLLAIGGFFRRLIDQGLTANYLYSINQSILVISGLIIIFTISSFFRSYFINNIAEKIINQIRQEAYGNIINFDISYFEELKIGDIISRLSTDTELIAKLIVNFLSFFIRNSIMLIGGIILMFLQSPKLALLVIITIPLLLVPLIKFGKYVKNLSKNALKSQSAIIANLEESLSNIRAIQAFNQQANRITDFNKQITNYLQYASDRLKIRSIFFALAISVILFSIVLVIWIGSRDIFYGNLSSGQMISFIYYAVIAGASSAGIFELLSEVSSSIVASERVFFLIDYASKNQTNNQTINVKNFSYNHKKTLPLIEFNKVSFSYPSRLDNIILNNLSFKINNDKFIGIVGRSGAGKSTMMQLLLKFYAPRQGIIKITDQDIELSNTKQIRQMIAYVPQDVSIFSGSIRSNIAFARPTSSEEEIVTAANITGIMEFVKDLKDGLDTEIGEKGIRLSGGQKQRIAVSRAILYDPEILLLDEAMSALDSENERKLLTKLRQVMKGKTIISIAHRISSIEDADEILVIDQGSLIARDIHNKLLEKCEIYQIICQEQSINL
jgi:ATP-binding cassette subfamily B protein